MKSKLERDAFLLSKKNNREMEKGERKGGRQEGRKGRREGKHFTKSSGNLEDLTGNDNIQGKILHGDFCYVPKFRCLHFHGEIYK